MRRLVIQAVLTGILTVAVSLPAWAASFSGKVSAVDGEKVTLKVEKGVPAWVKKGGVTKAIGGMPTVVDVKGNEVVLKFNKAKAAKINTELTKQLGEMSSVPGKYQAANSKLLALHSSYKALAAINPTKQGSRDDLNRTIENAERSFKLASQDLKTAVKDDLARELEEAKRKYRGFSSF